MKYIRTKDKIYASERWENHPTPSGKNVYYDINCNAPIIKEDDIVGMNDNIEELCDEFVVYLQGENNNLPMTVLKEMFDVFKKSILLGMKEKLNCWLNGAIWIDKGLIYVAKLNDKGELELL